MWRRKPDFKSLAVGKPDFQAGNQAGGIGRHVGGLVLGHDGEDVRARLEQRGEVRRIAGRRANRPRCRASCHSAARRTQSSAETRSRARSMALPAGSTKVRRQNRLATGASWAGLPSGKPNPLAAVQAQQRSAGEGRPFGVRLEPLPGVLFEQLLAEAHLPRAGQAASPRSTGSCRRCRRGGTLPCGWSGRLHCQMPLAP